MPKKLPPKLRKFQMVFLASKKGVQRCAVLNSCKDGTYNVRAWFEQRFSLDNEGNPKREDVGGYLGFIYRGITPDVLFLDAEDARVHSIGLKVA